MLTVGSLFSGIGGIDLGLERAGMTVRWQVEKDPYCQSVLRAHWPDVTLYEDTREVEWSDVERVDLVAAGFPCQPVSQSGLRLAQDDPRWLWPEVERAVRILRPRLVLLENVPGLLTAGFDDVLRDLAALGFDAEWSVLSACAVGAPQMRRRLFCVAYAPGQGLQGLDDAGFPVPLRPASSPVWRRWPPEPEVARMADGIPRRLVLDPIRALGNAVVPQVAELIGASLLQRGVDHLDVYGAVDPIDDGSRRAVDADFDGPIPTGRDIGHHPRAKDIADPQFKGAGHEANHTSTCSCPCHAVIQPGLVPCPQCATNPDHSSRLERP